MANFLTTKQAKTLKTIGYDVSADGFYIDLYRDEFDNDVWQQICYQADVSYDIDKLTFLSFGTMVNR
jgi:hypothetical protein